MICCCRWLVFVTALLLASGAAAQVRRGSDIANPASCGCDDKADLLNRANMAHAAMDFLRSIVVTPQGTIDAIDQKTGKINKDLIKRAIEEAQAEVQRAGLRPASGDTSGVTCEPKIDAGSACLEAVVRTHESMHQQICSREKSARKLDFIDDRLKGMPTQAYINEEIAGYQTELDDALRRLRALPASCRPSGWIGVITAFEDKAENITLTTLPPPHAKFALGTTETLDQLFQRWGKVWFHPQDPSAQWHLKQVYEKKTASKKQIYCGAAGLNPKLPNQTVTNTTITTSVGTGFADTVPGVSFSIDPQGKYVLSFRIPKMGADYVSKQESKSSGACPDPPDEKREGKGLFHADESDVLTSQGSIPAQSNYVGGSKTFKMLPMIPKMPGTTLTHEIRVVWHLHKY